MLPKQPNRSFSSADSGLQVILGIYPERALPRFINRFFPGFPCVYLRFSGTSSQACETQERAACARLSRLPAARRWCMTLKRQDRIHVAMPDSVIASRRELGSARSGRVASSAAGTAGMAAGFRPRGLPLRRAAHPWPSPCAARCSRSGSSRHRRGSRAYARAGALAHTGHHLPSRPVLRQAPQRFTAGNAPLATRLAQRIDVYAFPSLRIWSARRHANDIGEASKSRGDASLRRETGERQDYRRAMASVRQNARPTEHLALVAAGAGNHARLRPFALGQVCQPVRNIRPSRRKRVVCTARAARP